MNLEKLLNMCDNSVLDNLDVRFSRDAVSLQLKIKSKISNRFYDECV